MKMFRAIIRHDKESLVGTVLAKANSPVLTKWDVPRIGRQQRVQVGGQLYDELAKSTVLVVVEDDQVELVLSTIKAAAYSSYLGCGKISVTPVETAYTILTGQLGLWTTG